MWLATTQTYKHHSPEI